MGRKDNRRNDNQYKYRGRGGGRSGFGSQRGGGGGFRGGWTTRSPFSRDDRKQLKKSVRDPASLSDLKEDQVYVTEYASAGDGFHGILKSRFSDFQVNEIDNDGVEAVLTELKLPVAPKDEDEDATTVEAELVLLITKEKLDQIRKIADCEGKSTDVVEIDVTNLSKEDRGKIHNGAKTLFGSTIVGSTVAKGELKFITFAAYNKHTVKDRRTKWLWPHPFTHFMLFKENVDTIQAISRLAEQLKCNPSSFAYAGTKDRRAMTSQWVSIKLFDPAKIVAVARQNRNIKVGNFCFKPATLKLGQLRGNRFRIALRQVSTDEAVIQERLEKFREKGFINYFGLQRFGNNACVPTYKIGIEMLKGCWKEACNLILEPRSGDQWYMKQMRETWKSTGDPQSALNKLSPVNKTVEKQVLKWLVSHKNDFKGALENLPRNMRLLYCHSYQSLVWNRVVSRRIKELGYGLVAGDLVYVDKTLGEEASADVVDENPALEQPETDLPQEDEEPSTETSHFKNLVRPLTESDIESGQYTIFDLVLPLPGHDITYPANVCGTWYVDILAEDELSSEKLKRNVKKESLGGAYRKVFEKPQNLAWKFMSYENPTDTLILSDVEKLNGDKEPVSQDGAKHKALLLDFQLPSSTYATMALRELLKADTSAMHQRSLEQDQTKSESTTEISPSEDDESLLEKTNSIADDEVEGSGDEPVEKKLKLE